MLCKRVCGAEFLCKCVCGAELLCKCVCGVLAVMSFVLPLFYPAHALADSLRVL